MGYPESFNESEAHQQGRLKWDEPGGGYGFPLNSALRHLYEGRDRYP